MSSYVDNQGRTFDVSRWHKLSISQTFDDQQPNHFGTSPATCQRIQMGQFIGSTIEGGSCNVNEIRTITHCNGTHTETIGHIVDQPFPICHNPIDPFQTCALISINASSAANTEERYKPNFESGDQVITAEAISNQLKNVDFAGINALIIRTLPNDESKLYRKYGTDFTPAFFTFDAIMLINETGIQHLLTDLPSIDKTNDDGLLTCHHIFWNVTQGSHQTETGCLATKTITELIYVPDKVHDGIYLLNLQFADWASNAAASRPIIFPQISAL